LLAVAARQLAGLVLVDLEQVQLWLLRPEHLTQLLLALAAQVQALPTAPMLPLVLTEVILCLGRLLLLRLQAAVVVVITHSLLRVVPVLLVVPAVVLELINRNVVVPHLALGQQVCTTQMD
jgi:hypothetical protein